MLFALCCVGYLLQSISRSLMSSSQHRGGVSEVIPVYQVDGVGKDMVRKVLPMVQQLETHAKGRWLGREILEVLNKEFGGHSMQYWTEAFRHGHVRINGHTVTATYKFRNGDRFLHRTHRHEPPVCGEVSLVAEDENYFAVCKPASLPVHPCGSYRYNSLENILKYSPLSPTQPPKLHLVHRLDKVTSGLVIFAKTAAAAALISKEIQEKVTTVKRYVARVRGRFPDEVSRVMRTLGDAERVDFHQVLPDEGAEENETCNDAGNGSKEACALGVDNGLPLSGSKRLFSTTEQPQPDWRGSKEQRRKHFSRNAEVPSSHSAPSLTTVREHAHVGFFQTTTESQEWIEVQCPIGVVSKNDGIHACFPPPHGREALTRFRLVSYCPASDTSLIECQPITGRTHQIRLHCQLMGHPIANDPCYGGELFFADETRKERAQAAEQWMARQGLVPLTRILHRSSDSTGDSTAAAAIVEGAAAAAPSSEQESATTAAEASPARPEENERQEGESSDAFIARTCRYCVAMRQQASSSDGGLGFDPDIALHCDGIWLHAWQYSGETWRFETELPSWAGDRLL